MESECSLRVITEAIPNPARRNLPGDGKAFFNSKCRLDSMGPLEEEVCGWMEGRGEAAE
jgi:hypothetical protein